MSYQPQTEADTSRFLNVEEGGETLRIHFNDCGQGDETVVLLHGSGPGATGWANFSRNIDPLVEAGYRVILLDCPGWGKSDSIVNRGSRSDLNARVLKNVIDQLDINKVHLLGNSMGGHSAVAFHSELAGTGGQAGADGRRNRRHEPVYADADGRHQAAERPVSANRPSKT
ncbi:2-hydroxy-6-oxononadienedioate/2-hydroxy-6-oxononatrienedioate hydrolase [Raoultella planticola]|uniref:2-hydroxy-6-oxononadienedioate/2-hydroxy-6-oxonon atrienedioate hydrolase n=1 Tax=Raoultella planticola TaxID=575 RepID=A0A485AFF2_RAOPL|nr:2-hydroxy-6-oxononadienedioate/2-hydroxy-6-oxononatrienedioate hydrolase [Raoultella planticola]